MHKFPSGTHTLDYSKSYNIQTLERVYKHYYYDNARDENMYPTMYNRDEIFFRLGLEKSDALLEKIKNVENPNFQDTLGMSYLHRACQAHYPEAVELLLKLGADPNITDKRGNSPILDAIGSINDNNNTILEIMLQYGLDLNQIENGMTLKEKIEEFNDSEMNKIVEKYYHK